MTARDEAIQAILDMPKRHMIAKLDAEFFGSALDAIPANVLARLAIEQGALEEIGYVVASRGEFIANEDWEPRYRGLVFRVVEP